jgi:hypothetical protein
MRGSCAAWCVEVDARLFPPLVWRHALAVRAGVPQSPHGLAAKAGFPQASEPSREESGLVCGASSRCREPDAFSLVDARVRRVICRASPRVAVRHVQFEGRWSARRRPYRHEPMRHHREYAHAAPSTRLRSPSPKVTRVVQVRLDDDMAVCDLLGLRDRGGAMCGRWKGPPVADDPLSSMRLV